MNSGGGPVHTSVPILAHPKISQKQSQLHIKLPRYMIKLIVIYVAVKIFSMKNNKSLRKLRVGVNGTWACIGESGHLGPFQSRHPTKSAPSKV